MQDSLIIGIDTSEKEDHTCLIVARRYRGVHTVINEFYDEEARQVYKKLTGRSIQGKEN